MLGVFPNFLRARQDFGPKGGGGVARPQLLNLVKLMKPAMEVNKDIISYLFWFQTRI